MVGRHHTSVDNRRGAPGDREGSARRIASRLTSLSAGGFANSSLSTEPGWKNQPADESLAVGAERELPACIRESGQPEVDEPAQEYGSEGTSEVGPSLAPVEARAKKGTTSGPECRHIQAEVPHPHLAPVGQREAGTRVREMPMGQERLVQGDAGLAREVVVARPRLAEAARRSAPRRRCAGRDRHERLDSGSHVRAREGVVAVAALAVDGDEAAGLEPGEVPAGRRRRHAPFEREFGGRVRPPIHEGGDHGGARGVGEERSRTRKIGGCKHGSAWSEALWVRMEGVYGLTLPRLMRTLTYTARVVWDGNSGTGTSTYAGYDRRYRVKIDGKPDLAGSSDAAFRGDADRHNPEDLFLSALSACHMLVYLGLCAREGIRVDAYEDACEGTLELQADGAGRFTSVVLAPHVTVAADTDAALAERLHDLAHARCFIANSCSAPIRLAPHVVVASALPTDASSLP